MSKANQAWEYLYSKFFYEKTNLFYDYRISQDADGLISHLPPPEHIRRSIPNPCGWGSGMEDSMISGGLALDLIIHRYDIEKDPDLIPVAQRIFQGMYHCATVSDCKGFLARSVSPVDGITHYMDSSRDQYTHWVFSALHYYHSSIISEKEKTQIQEVLIAFAKRAEQNITEENSWNYLREDGKRGAVVGMWGNIHPHEAFRLPMIYLAAWEVSRNQHFCDLYLQFRDKALEKSESIDLVNAPPLLFGLSQMMHSLRFAYDYDPDEAFQVRCLALMQRLARYGYDKAIEHAKENSKPENVELLNYIPKPWNEVPAYLDLILDDYAYFVPSQLFTWRPNLGMARRNLANVGDAASVFALCPDTLYDEELMQAVTTMLDVVDYEKHYTNGPLYLLAAYWALKNKHQ